MDRGHIKYLQEIDQQFHLHPFTHHPDMHEAGTRIIFSAEGCFVRDEQGRQLLDGLAGLWCVNAGYGRSEIVRAVSEQMERLPYYTSFFNTTTEPPILLAKKLAELAPERINHALFCNSGSEAIETALKLIRAYNKLKGRSATKHKILSRTFSYHGVGMASGSLTGIAACTEPFDLPLPGVLHVPAPYAYGCGKEADAEAYGQWCIEETARTIATEGSETIAAMFVEPIQGAGGVIMPPAGYLSALRQLCREKDILFVADEVITGFGRIGDWFASLLWDLDPDIMCMAKGITSGYLPLGATMLSNEIVATLHEGGYLAHGFTYSGHPASCAAALANIAIIEREGLCQRVHEQIGPYLQRKLAVLGEHPAVGEVRGTGLIAAIELLPAEGRQSTDSAPGLGLKGAALAREEGLIVRGIRDLIAIAPPLIISESEVDLLVERIEKMLGRLWG